MLRNDTNNAQNTNVCRILQGKPDAVAIIQGSENYPLIKGICRLYQTNNGVIVATEIIGLPFVGSACKSNIFAYHIHEGEVCSGNESDPFADARAHYNPKDCMHPYHAGDLAPLFGNNGYALSIFITDRFSVKEVIGKTVIVHVGVDDFSTQPAGNAGAKIACGKIV